MLDSLLPTSNYLKYFESMLQFIIFVFGRKHLKNMGKNKQTDRPKKTPKKPAFGIIQNGFV